MGINPTDATPLKPAMPDQGLNLVIGHRSGPRKRPILSQEFAPLAVIANQQFTANVAMPGHPMRMQESV